MRNHYSLSEIISTSYSLFLTKILYSHARLVRRPVYVRGRKSLIYGKGLTTGHGCRLDLEGTKKTLFIGDSCEIGDYVHIVARENVSIGNGVLIASKVFISDTNHGNYSGENQDSPYSPPNSRELTTEPVQIGNNVWIGENVVILPGTIVGDGCIIGANAVVKGKYENNTIIVGVPAKSIKSWNENKQLWEKMGNNK